MMISTKGRYALRMLVDMAEHERGGGYVPLKEIAARQEISEKYLESIVKLLVQNNVLIGVRGKGGGYRLNGTPDQFTVRRILEITEGSLAPVACLCEPHEPCARMANCRTYPMWQGLSKLICDYLDSYTLADLMKSDDAGFRLHHIKAFTHFDIPPFHGRTGRFSLRLSDARILPSKSWPMRVIISSPSSFMPCPIQLSTISVSAL